MNILLPFANIAETLVWGYYMLEYACYVRRVINTDNIDLFIFCLQNIHNDIKNSYN